MTEKLLRIIPVLAGIAVCSCGPGMDRLNNPPLHDTQTIDLDKTEMTRVELRMGAGELQAAGGSPKLLEADFTYPPNFKPVMRYNASSFRGQLSIEQPHGFPPGSQHG